MLPETRNPQLPGEAAPKAGKGPKGPKGPAKGPGKGPPAPGGKGPPAPAGKGPGRTSLIAYVCFGEGETAFRRVLWGL